MNKIYRQGDVLVVSIKLIPKSAEASKDKGDIILAHGEVTGHAHRIAEQPAKAALWSANAERFLQVMETVALTHEEHSTVTIPPGNYQVVIQTEYSPIELRKVTD